MAGKATQQQPFDQLLSRPPAAADLAGWVDRTGRPVKTRNAHAVNWHHHTATAWEWSDVGAGVA